MFSGLTNQMSSWMGAVKGDEAAGDGTQSEQQIQSEGGAVDQAQAAFENVPVTLDEEGKATR